MKFTKQKFNQKTFQNEHTGLLRQTIVVLLHPVLEVAVRVKRSENAVRDCGAAIIWGFDAGSALGKG